LGLQAGSLGNSTGEFTNRQEIIMEWLTQNIGTIVVAAFLVFIVVLVVRGMIKNKKKGGGCTCSDCSHCAGGCAMCNMMPPADKKFLQANKVSISQNPSYEEKKEEGEDSEKEPGNE